MAVFNGAFPILPGKEGAARAFAEAVAGPRKAEFDEMQARAGVQRETWAVQQTDAGSFMLVWFEGPDIEAAFTDLATGQDDFTVWFRGQIQGVTGLDMAEPPGDDAAPPEVVFEWSK